MSSNKDVLITEQEVAEMLGIKKRTLQTWRARATCPIQFEKIGDRLVRARLSEVQAYINKTFEGGHNA